MYRKNTLFVLYHIHSYTHTHTHTHTLCDKYTHTHLHISINSYTLTNTHTYVNTHTLAYTHKHTRIHTNTYAHTHTLAYAHITARAILSVIPTATICTLTSRTEVNGNLTTRSFLNSTAQVTIVYYSICVCILALPTAYIQYYL